MSRGEPGSQDRVVSEFATTRASEARIAPVFEYLEEIPWWMIILFILALIVSYSVLTSQLYQDTIRFLWNGVLMTIRVSVVGYAVALLIGLITGLGRVSDNPVFHSISTLYVEIVRGIPILVQLLYVGFVVAPALARWLGIQKIDEPTRAIFGLAFAYGAYLAEIFRAGVEAIGRGQMEAARSLGMSYFQAMRYVILPQAFRVILPPLGNDFIAILKDSSLASVLSVRELTHLGRLNVSRTFDTFTTWNMVALLYLMMTLALSLGVRVIERNVTLE